MSGHSKWHNIISSNLRAARLEQLANQFWSNLGAINFTNFNKFLKIIKELDKKSQFGNKKHFPVDHFFCSKNIKNKNNNCKK